MAKACAPYRVKFARLLELAVAVIVVFFNSYGDGLLHIVEELGSVPSVLAFSPPTSRRTRAVGHPAAFILEVWVARSVVVVAAGGLRAGRYRSSAGTRPSDRSDPSDGRRR